MSIMSARDADITLAQARAQLDEALRLNAQLLAKHDTDTITIQQLQAALATANNDRRELRTQLSESFETSEVLHDIIDERPVTQAALARVTAGDRIAAEPSVTSEPALEAGSVKRLAICNSAQGGVS